ncbi:MAG: DUF6084 family protein [Gemmatimonadota bacterium]
MTAQAQVVPPEPALALEVIGARFAPAAATPNLVFTLEVNDRADREIYAIALSCQVNIEPEGRRYDSEARLRLAQVLGEPRSNARRRIMWMERDTLVSSFRGATAFDLPVPVTYDMEIAATRYFYSLSEGEVPLRFYFRGTVFYQAGEGALQMTPVPWETEATYRFPLALWKTMMARYYPNSTWIRLRPETLTGLLNHQSARGLASIDEAVVDLLRRTGSGAAAPKVVGGA